MYHLSCDIRSKNFNWEHIPQCWMENRAFYFQNQKLFFILTWKNLIFARKFVDFLGIFKVPAVNSIDIQSLESWTKDCPTKECPVLRFWGILKTTRSLDGILQKLSVFHPEILYKNFSLMKSIKWPEIDWKWVMNHHWWFEWFCKFIKQLIGNMYSMYNFALC